MKKNSAVVSAFTSYLANRMAAHSAAASIASPFTSLSTMSVSKKPTENVDDLVRRLANLEMIIEKLFLLPNSSAIQERKISQFEEMIAEFPDGAGKTADHWRDKVVSFWHRMAVGEVAAAQGQHSVTVDRMMPSSPARSSQLLDAWKSLIASPRSSISKKTSKQVELLPLGDSSKKSKQANSDQPQQQMQSAAAAAVAKMTLLTTPPGSQVSTPRRNSDEVRKQALRSSMENSFSNLADITSGADVDAVKHLLTEVARAQNQLANYPSDPRLHFDVFNFAFRKLPHTMREQFLTIYGVRQNGINMANLVAFLQAEIVSQHSKTVWLLSVLASKKNKENGNNNNVTGGAGNSSNGGHCQNHGKKTLTLGPMPLKWNNSGGVSNDANYCKYCKSVGHNPTGCPYIKELLCFQCYGYGHTKRACPNKPMY